MYAERTLPYTILTKLRQTLSIELYTMQPVQLASDELRQRAKILRPPISVEEVINDEVVELERREGQENKAVKEMEQKRAEEKERGRTEIRQEFEEKRTGRREVMRELKEEIFHGQNTLPVCTRTPRMLITGKTAYQKFTH